MLTGVLVCKKVINTFSFVRAHFLSTSIDYDGAPFLNAYINHRWDNASPIGNPPIGVRNYYSLYPYRGF